jgi:hypothetical protein
MQGTALQEATQLKLTYSLSQRLMCRQVLSRFADFTGTKVRNTDAAAAASLSQRLMCRQVLSRFAGFTGTKRTKY